MISSNTTDEDDEYGYPMRWAARRLIIAGILVVALIGALVFGIFAILNSSSVSAPTIKNGNHSVVSKKPSTSSVTTDSNPSQPSVNLSTVNPQSQLTNTGPGNSVFVSFTAATVIGVAAHYVWRKRQYR